MAAGIPPPPLNSPAGSYYWLEWYTTLTNFLNETNIPWTNLNFTGSNLTDIQTRNHNDLQNIQGGTTSTGTPGKAWHLKGAEFIGSCTGAGVAISLPGGWTVSGGGGTVTVVHNLATTLYVVVCNPTTVLTTFRTVVGANSFQFISASASDFEFVLCQGS